MKLKIYVIGKSDPEFVRAGVDFYLKKLSHLCSVEWKELIPKLKNIDPERTLTIESEILLKHLDSGDQLILLDEKGLNFKSSLNFSDYIQKKQNSGIKTVVFLIGGAYGFDVSIYNRANEKISMAPMTFSHQNIRLIFLEQLYRAYSILNHLPYHHP